MQLGLETTSFLLAFAGGAMNIFSGIEEIHALGLNGIQINTIRGKHLGHLGGDESGYLRSIRTLTRKLGIHIGVEDHEYETCPGLRDPVFGMLGVMAFPFYQDMGYSGTEIGIVSGLVGKFITIAGALLGGVLVVRYGVMRMLLAGAAVVILTNLLFAWLAGQPPLLVWLVLVVGADNLAGGLAGTVFIAYLSGLTNRAYTATQYALFSSIMLLLPKFIGGFSGIVVDASSYPVFFLYAAALGLPAIVLILLLMRREPAPA